MTELLERFARHERRALARMLTLVESGEAPPLERLAEFLPRDHSTREAFLVVGVTGSGGSGKSTLVGALCGHLRQMGKTVAVLACDPSSPLTGGALLGDRIRVRIDPGDEGVFFRSLSVRGAAGGVSPAVGPMLGWLKAFGFDVVLVETVGTGQDQVAVRELVDRLVLVVTPGGGDEVQWDKAGVIEVADIIVVNKQDLPGAARVQGDLVRSLSLLPGREPPPVLGAVATTGEGIADLWAAVDGSREAAESRPDGGPQ